MQAAGDITGGKATCEEAKSAARKAVACMREAEEAEQAACRQDAQAAELSMHAKLLQRSVKVLPHIYLAQIVLLEFQWLALRFMTLLLLAALSLPFPSDSS